MRLEILRCPFLLAALLAGHATFAQSTIQAVRHEQPLRADTPTTIQERGWSSPIWYTPKKSNAA